MMNRLLFAFVGAAALSIIAGCSGATEPDPVLDLDGTNQLIPLAVGNEWQYDQAKRPGAYWLLAPSKVISRTEAVEDDGGRMIWYLTAIPRSERTGIEIDTVGFGVTGEGIIAARVQDGISQKFFATLSSSPSNNNKAFDEYHWKGTETITTPAGTFADSYIAERNIINPFDIQEIHRMYFKRGIGLVKSSYQTINSAGELVYSDSTMLTSYTVHPKP